MIKNQDLARFTGQYPYASELFGVYQSLIGWRGARSHSWFVRGYERDRIALRDSIFKNLRAVMDVQQNEEHVLSRIGRIDIGTANSQVRFGSALIAALAGRLPHGANLDSPDVWRNVLNDDVVRAALNREVRDQAKSILTTIAATPPALQHNLDAAIAGGTAGVRADSAQLRTQRTMQFIDHESRIAGQLRLLRDVGAVGELKQLFRGRTTSFVRLSDMGRFLGLNDPFGHLDPKSIVGRAMLSPIGVIHLFRQYFFELDSFLGSPAGHVWVAPGTTVELVEINTRRTITEMSIDESALSRIEQFGESFSLEDLHEAVSRSNQQDLSYGASVSGSHSWIVGSVEASASTNYHQTQSESRLTVHDLMRRRTERVTSLMERSVRTAFKTVSDKTEVSSKRYVISNPTAELINYELRRKMRRVAVQVQDVGTYLSWQSFVDDPGRELGVANLVHIAEPPNLANIPHPQLIIPKEPRVTKETVLIPFQPVDADEGDKDDEEWDFGSEVGVDGPFDSPEDIEWVFPQRFRSPDADYYLFDVKTRPLGDATVTVNRQGEQFIEKDGYFNFKLYLDHAHFHGSDNIPVELELLWETREDQVKIQQENANKLATFVAQQKRAYEEAYVKAARERIDVASKIAPRRYEDLRQEERIAVFRRLVRSLAPGHTSPNDDRETPGSRVYGYPTMSDQTRHAWSEILNRIFDLEKMLYFVAPEWWKPRPQSFQTMGSEEPVLDGDGNVVIDTNGNVVMQPARRTAIPDRSVVSWGGAAEAGRPNYYITETSAPAHLGASLGWLLQLDGDAMRNAFLNAPWVKAIVPVRPGQEHEAINWLESVVEGNEGLTPELRAQLEELANKVADKHAQSVRVQTIPDLVDPNQTVSATPVDRVFEFGFDPLQGGFRAQSIDGGEFEIVDQWVEVVPTDQVAAVEVKYDAATGRQVP